MSRRATIKNDKDGGSKRGGTVYNLTRYRITHPFWEPELHTTTHTIVVLSSLLDPSLLYIRRRDNWIRLVVATHRGDGYDTAMTYPVVCIVGGRYFWCCCSFFSIPINSHTHEGRVTRAVAVAAAASFRATTFRIRTTDLVQRWNNIGIEWKFVVFLRGIGAVFWVSLYCSFYPPIEWFPRT